VTPPALARMSGITVRPRLNSMSSAIGVVGPFAASAMIFAFTREAFAEVIWFSSAAGTRMSTGSSSSALFEIDCPGRNVPRLWPPSLCLWSAAGFSPFGSCTPPRESEAATISAPSALSSVASSPPALPKP